MTKLIDTYLLNHGMPAKELCAIKSRRYYYFGIGLFGALAIAFIAFAILGVNPPL